MKLQVNCWRAFRAWLEKLPNKEETLWLSSNVQSQYEAKIAELEQYYILLQQHLNKMENLKENMFQFWDDDNARQAGQVLTLTIRQVTSSMTMTQETLAFYKSAVAKLGATKSVTSGLLDSALQLLSGGF